MNINSLMPRLRIQMGLQLPTWTSECFYIGHCKMFGMGLLPEAIRSSKHTVGLKKNLQFLHPNLFRHQQQIEFLCHGYFVGDSLIGLNVTLAYCLHGELCNGSHAFFLQRKTSTFCLDGSVVQHRQIYMSN